MAHLTAQQLGALIDRYAGPLELYAAQWTTMAPDVVQEAFMALIQSEPLPEQPAAWLYRTVRNKALNAQRAASRRSQHEQRHAQSISWISSGINTPDNAIDSDELVAALQELPGDQREVIVARLWGGLTYDQIASTMDVSIATVYRRYESGIATLKRRFQHIWKTIEPNSS